MFLKNWHGRFSGSEPFRFVFEQAIKLCVQEGLNSDVSYAFAANVVEADASR